MKVICVISGPLPNKTGGTSSGLGLIKGEIYNVTSSCISQITGGHCYVIKNLGTKLSRRFLLVDAPEIAALEQELKEIAL